MRKPRLLHQVAVYGATLPTLVASPAVAKATIYLPSHVAAEMLGRMNTEGTIEGGRDVRVPMSDTSHAA